MPKYTDIREVVQETLNKYKKVKKLSKDELGCSYSHKINGIGCAIGCHLSDRDAAYLERYRHGVSVIALLDPECSHSLSKSIGILKEVFDVGTISQDDLQWLQRSHDWSRTVEEFRAKLHAFLSTGTWASSNV